MKKSLHRIKMNLMQLSTVLSFSHDSTGHLPKRLKGLSCRPSHHTPRTLMKSRPHCSDITFFSSAVAELSWGFFFIASTIEKRNNLHLCYCLHKSSKESVSPVITTVSPFHTNTLNVAVKRKGSVMFLFDKITLPTVSQTINKICFCVMHTTF